MKITRALISVSNKKGVASFARALEKLGDRKSTRLNSSHEWISYAVFCLKKKSEGTRGRRSKNECAEAARCISSYCGGGCGQVVCHRNVKLFRIDVYPHSGITRSHLCSKG